jgi:hypothetical protein
MILELSSDKFKWETSPMGAIGKILWSDYKKAYKAIVGKDSPGGPGEFYIKSVKTGVIKRCYNRTKLYMGDIDYWAYLIEDMNDVVVRIYDNSLRTDYQLD